MKGFVCTQYQNYRNTKKVFFYFVNVDILTRRTIILTKTTMAMMVMVMAVKQQNDVDVDRNGRWQLCSLTQA